MATVIFFSKDKYVYRRTSPKPSGSCSEILLSRVEMETYDKIAINKPNVSAYESGDLYVNCIPIYRGDMQIYSPERIL